MPTDRELLAEARQQLADMAAEMERLSQAALSYGTIIGAYDGKQVLATSGGMYSIPASKFPVGESVLLAPMTMEPFEKAPYPLVGNVVDIARVGDDFAEIDQHGDPVRILIGRHKVKAGDKVLLDPSGSIVTAIVQKAKDYVPKVEKVTWADIGGQEEAKRLLIEAVELPRKHPKVYAHYDKKTTKGILLSGPPGCGKTMLGKAVAGSVGAQGGGFIAVKGPEILDPYVGVAEANVRGLFRKAEAFKAEHGTEAVIFIDEAEAILAKRGGHHSYMEKTIVPMFLTEMDGLEKSSAIVILSTNRPELLDPAIVRDGRIDYEVQVSRPNINEAADIMDIHIGKKPVKGDRHDIITQAVSHLYACAKLPHSGALIAGLVEKAAASAIRRDLHTGKLTGLMVEDFAQAVNVIKEQEGLQYAA